MDLISVFKLVHRCYLQFGSNSAALLGSALSTVLWDGLLVILLLVWVIVPIHEEWCSHCRNMHFKNWGGHITSNLAIGEVKPDPMCWFANPVFQWALSFQLFVPLPARMSSSGSSSDESLSVWTMTSSVSSSSAFGVQGSWQEDGPCCCTEPEGEKRESPQRTADVVAGLFLCPSPLSDGCLLSSPYCCEYLCFFHICMLFFL